MYTIWNPANACRLPRRVCCIESLEERALLSGQADTPFPESGSLADPFGDVSGSVFEDRNRNGVRDAGEGPLAGALVHLGDLSLYTDAEGSFQFQQVPIARYVLRVELPTGWVATIAYGDDVEVLAGVNDDGHDFGFYGFVGVTGRVFYDRNGNLSPDGVDWGVAERVVYIDFDGDDVLDEDEPFATTNPAGYYYLETFDLRGGSLKLQRIAQRASGVSSFDLAPGVGIYSFDFSAIPLTTVKGALYVDQNRNGRRDPSESGAGWRIYVDHDRNRRHDAGEPIAEVPNDGQFTFADLPPGPFQLRVIRSDLRLSSLWIAQRSAKGERFSNFNLPINPVGNITGKLFEDLVREGRLNPADKAFSGTTAFVDYDRDGLLDRREPRTGTESDGSFVLYNIRPGTYSIGFVLTEGWRSTTEQFQSVTVELGVETAAEPFGLTRNASLVGTVFNDSNANGVRNGREKNLAGWRVWLDLDNDGQFDRNEPSAVTGNSGSFRLSSVPPGRHVLRLETKKGYAPTKRNNAALKLTLAPGQILRSLLFGVRPITSPG